MSTTTKKMKQLVPSKKGPKPFITLQREMDAYDPRTGNWDQPNQKVCSYAGAVLCFDRLAKIMGVTPASLRDVVLQRGSLRVKVTIEEVV